MLINRCGGGSGSSVYETLPPQVTGFSATPGNAQVVLNWINPTSSYFTGVVIVRKAGSTPSKVTDGEKVYDGTGTTYTDTGLTNGTTYYYRAFSYNSKKQYNTDITAATASATPQAGQAISNLPVGAIVDIPRNGVSCPHYVIGQNHSGYPANSTTLFSVNSQETRAVGSYNYSSSALRTYLNNDYLNTFSSTVRAKILTTTIASNGSNIQDNIFLLSATELGLSPSTVEGSAISGITSAIRNATSSDLYWTRTKYDNSNILVILTDGTLGFRGYSSTSGIRTALNFDNTALVSLQPNANGYYTLM